MVSVFRLSAFVYFVCLAAAANTADQGVVTEYGYDAEGNITSTTRTLLTAPPVVERVRPSFVRKGGNCEITLIGSNLRSASVTVAAESMGVISVKSGDSPVVVLSVPDSVADGIYSLSVSTALGSTSASFEVRSPLPALNVLPLPLEATAVGNLLTESGREVLVTADFGA